MGVDVEKLRSVNGAANERSISPGVAEAVAVTPLKRTLLLIELASAAASDERSVSPDVVKVRLFRPA